MKWWTVPEFPDPPLNLDSQHLLAFFRFETYTKLHHLLNSSDADVDIKIFARSRTVPCAFWWDPRSCDKMSMSDGWELATHYKASGNYSKLKHPSVQKLGLGSNTKECQRFIQFIIKIQTKQEATSASGGSISAKNTRNRWTGTVAVFYLKPVTC